MASQLIQGRTVSFPVRVRDVMVCGALYLVRADAARAVLTYSGQDVAEVLPGKAVCVLVFADYRDGDLHAYREFGMDFLTRRRGATGWVRQGGIRGDTACGHWMPVEEGCSVAAGRAVWGVPKKLAELDLWLHSPYSSCILRSDGRL